MQEQTERVEIDADEQRQWYAFGYVLTLLPAALEAQMQRDAHIGHFDYLVLSTLAMAPRRCLRMRELAQYTASTLSRLSNVVTRLETRGWVTRSPDPGDGRSTLAVLTDAGLDKANAARPAHLREVRRLVLDPLSTTQKRHLDTISQRILTALDAPCPTDWPLLTGD